MSADGPVSGSKQLGWPGPEGDFVAAPRQAAVGDAPILSHATRERW